MSCFTLPVPRSGSFAALDALASPEDAVFPGGLHDFHNSEPPAGALFLASFRFAFHSRRSMIQSALYHRRDTRNQMDTWLPEPIMTAKRIASECPMEHLLVLIGGRWKPVILWWLSESRKPLRFKDLRENMPRISQKVLTQQLRELERDALIKRQMFPEMPVRVEYSLTPFGRKLRPVLRVLDTWSRKHVVGGKGSISSISS